MKLYSAKEDVNVLLPAGNASLPMSGQPVPRGIRERAGYYLGYVIGFQVIMTIGVILLWVSMEPHHSLLPLK